MCILLFLLLIFFLIDYVALKYEDTKNRECQKLEKTEKVKILCRRCSKEFELDKTYRLCDEVDGDEIAVCFPCLEIIMRTLIEISKTKIYKK